MSTIELHKQQQLFALYLLTICSCIITYFYMYALFTLQTSIQINKSENSLSTNSGNTGIPSIHQSKAEPDQNANPRVYLLLIDIQVTYGAFWEGPSGPDSKEENDSCYALRWDKILAWFILKNSKKNSNIDRPFFEEFCQ